MKLSIKRMQIMKTVFRCGTYVSFHCGKTQYTALFDTELEAVNFLYYLPYCNIINF